MSGKDASREIELDAVKKQIDSQFPVGRFVAIQAGDVVADADSHRELVRKLSAMGKSVKDMLVLQAGIQYPESAIILLEGYV